MNRVTLFLVIALYMSSALAHPGHDAPEPHLHAIWEVVLLVAAIGACVVIFIKRTSSRRRGRKHARFRL
jgi:uncharacterized membrane protein YeaQ/YmgE (transglycosylase-associated protein family)